jgi:hypothetical protein
LIVGQAGHKPSMKMRLSFKQHQRVDPLWARYLFQRPFGSIVGLYTGLLSC